jgi:nitroreductase
MQRYATLMEVIRARHTCRAFAPAEVPRAHFEMILEAARHSPSGANTQPWHFIVAADPELKARISAVFVEEQLRRARLHMRFPTPNYKGVRTAPGVIVIVADFRWVRAFPLLNDGSDLDRAYRQNAERILAQSVAASTMAAHLAAAALGYGVWWITAIGQEAIQREIKPLLGVPESLAVIDVMCFGPPLNAPYTRHKRLLSEIVSWNRYNPDSYATDEHIEAWIKTERSRWMYRDESRVD